MARISTYSNFRRNTEEAFNFTNPFLEENLTTMELQDLYWCKMSNCVKNIT
jgi:hypothetical protein